MAGFLVQNPVYSASQASEILEIRAPVRSPGSAVALPILALSPFVHARFVSLEGSGAGCGNIPAIISKIKRYTSVSARGWCPLRRFTSYSNTHQLKPFTNNAVTPPAAAGAQPVAL